MSVARRWGVRAVALLARCLAAVTLVAVAVPILVNALPGDAADVLAGVGADAATMSMLRHNLGLDAPLMSQAADSVAATWRGDFGHSLVSGEPVSQILWQRLAVSAWIVVPAWLAAVLIGAWISARTALGRRGTGRLVSVLCGVPDAVVAVVLVVSLGVWLAVLPAVSLVEPGQSVAATPNVLVLPALALAIPATAWIIRMTGGIARDITAREYVQDALDRGHSPSSVARRHVLPAMGPVVAQVAALSAGALLAGSVVVEQVVAYPGLGELLASAVGGRDLPVIRAVAIVMAAITALLLGLADLWDRSVRGIIHAAT